MAGMGTKMGARMRCSETTKGNGLKKLEEKKTSSRSFNKCIRDNTEKAMAPHSSTLAWKIPWMEEPGRLQSMGLLRVGHD